MLMISAQLGCSESFWVVVMARSPHTGPEFGYPRLAVSFARRTYQRVVPIRVPTLSPRRDTLGLAGRLVVFLVVLRLGDMLCIRERGSV